MRLSRHRKGRRRESQRRILSVKLSLATLKAALEDNQLRTGHEMYMEQSRMRNKDPKVLTDTEMYVLNDKVAALKNYSQIFHLKMKMIRRSLIMFCSRLSANLVVPSGRIPRFEGENSKRSEREYSTSGLSYNCASN